MPTNKKQVLRLVRLVAELKENRFPNARSFAAGLRRDTLGGEALVVSVKTVQRDIRVLREEFLAPIGWSAEHNGYYLTNPYWQFNCPLLGDTDVMASVLSLRIAEQLVPDPVRQQMEDAVAATLGNNSTDRLEWAFINALIVGSGGGHWIDPDTFATVFDGWRRQMTLAFQYRKPGAAARQARRAEPHVLVHENLTWYVKGRDPEIAHRQQNVRLFALHRMQEVEICGPTFQTDRKLAAEVRRHGPYSYASRVWVARIRFAAVAAGYAREKAALLNETVQENSDRSITVVLHDLPEYEVVRMVLAAGGDAELLEPADLRETIHVRAAAAAAIHQNAEGQPPCS